MGVVPTGLVVSCSTLDHSIASAMGSFLCHLLLETASIRIQEVLSGYFHHIPIASPADGG